MTRSGLTVPEVPRLQVTDLGVEIHQSGAAVVADINITLHGGQVLALVGESGSGKSTSGLATMGWARSGLKISGGSVEIDGQDILSMSATDLCSARGRLISYVPQDPTSGLNPALRVGDQLLEALTNHGIIPAKDLDDRVLEMLAQVGLPSDPRILRSFPHQLSGGQQQRVAIAMAFACRPRVVVLDEPTTGLDVSTQRRVLETVRSLASEYGCSAIYVSHDLAVVANIADQVAVMYAGRIIEYGPTKEIFESPRHHYTAGLLASIPDVERPGGLDGIPGSPPRPGRWPEGCSFAQRCAASEEDCTEKLPELTSVNAAHTVRCFHPVEGSRDWQGRLATRPSGNDASVVVSARKVNASFGTKQVLHGVELDLFDGGCTAIVGESGSGKTTLARCVVGLNGHWEGDVQLFGHSVHPAAANRTKEQRRRMQYIFQNPHSSLNPRMTIGQNIDEPLRFFKGGRASRRDELICQALADVALGEAYFDRFPDQLSGGERQRAAIARALVVDPDILVCDEITSALDVSVQAQVIERLRLLQAERGVSMIFITHNIAVVRSIAQRIAVMSQGRVVESGSVEEVITNPQHAYTKQLLTDLPRLTTTRANAS